MNTSQHKYCQQSEKDKFASHGEFSEPFFLNTKSTQAYLLYIKEVIVSDVHAVSPVLVVYLSGQILIVHGRDLI